MADDSKFTYILWHYSPSLWAGAVAIAVFAILTVANSVRLGQSRAWFCIPMVIGGMFEVIGYACRIWSHYNQKGVVPFAIQATLLLLAPILFAASGYMVLSRIVRAARGEAQSMVRPRFLTAIFVTGDVITFLIQSSGASLLSSADTKQTQDTGHSVVLAGLIAQVIIFIVFVAVAVVWHRRMNAVAAVSGLPAEINWRALLFGLYAFSLLILTRNVVRCVEYGMQDDGYLNSHEWTTYVFDAIPMAVVMAISLTWYRRELIFQRPTSSNDEEARKPE